MLYYKLERPDLKVIGLMMEMIEGKQNGSQLFVYKNYSYCMDKRYDHIFRCSKRKTEKCSGVLKKEGESFTLEIPHNHSEELYILEINNMKKEMIQLSKQTTKSFKDIFDTVCRKNLLAASYISYNNIKSILSRERIKSRPKIPNNLYSLHQQLEIYEPIHRIYKGCAISNDNKVALIFSSDTLLKLLSEAREVFVDGTFSIVPKKPNITQLYSIHVRYADTDIAVVFVLCEGRSIPLYKGMWEKIISLAPGLKENLKFIMADYEKAALIIMSQQFPAASIHGCWFYYCQALYRKWRRLQLNNVSREFLSMAMSMALAPSDLFVDSLNIMQNIADRISANYPNVLLFMAYLRNTWLPIAPKVSVHNCPARTNNLVESFHHITNQKIGTINPNLWVFLEHLSEIVTNQEIDYARLQNNIRVRRPRTRFNKERNNKIKDRQYALINGDITLEHFLHMFSHFNPYEQQELPLEVNDHEEVDASLLSDRNPESAETGYTQNFNRRRRRFRNTSVNSSRQQENFLSKSSDLIDEQHFENVAEQNNDLIDEQHFENAERNNDLINEQHFENVAEQNSNPIEYFENVTEQNNEYIISDDEDYRIPEDDFCFLNESITSETFHEVGNMEKLIDENREIRPVDTCIVCLTEKASYVFVPCGHLCVCESCSTKLQHKRCPLYNTEYDNCIKIITS
ncbi:uncharacterized protein LOC105840333 isoform X3 [Monomorium pharaonis]|uniref:uncharacterized protein LOC105840333 isoform X3 n=2 Tax=Monomorium pharaonis TaxID=307658 RepID=UPI0017462F7E|nr:uncharacterized protein LOC105840333 isoform X3 [Monomorium pharaonis]